MPQVVAWGGRSKALEKSVGVTLTTQKPYPAVRIIRVNPLFILFKIRAKTLPTMSIRKHFAGALAALLATATPLSAQQSASALPSSISLPIPWQIVGTFSILGYDPETGEIGAAVQSRVFSVGNGVIWAEAGVGAAASQAVVDVSYGPQAIALLKTGMTPDAIVKKVWNDDPDTRKDWAKTGRQFAVMDAKGNTAVYTGPTAPDSAGHKMGKFCTAQGNTLATPKVVDSMVAAFERTKGHLSMRLLAAIEAGQMAGGDKRGMQSAAILVVKKDGGVWVHNDVVMRLQVDDNPEPIKELRRLVEKSPVNRRRPPQ